MQKTLALFLLATSPLLSNTESPAECCTDPTSHVQFGPNYTWANISPSGLSSTSGSMGGLQAMYEYRTARSLYAGLAFEWRQGNTTGGSGSERSLCYIDLQERIGYSVDQKCDIWECSFFTGFGYRHHGENVTASSSSTSVAFEYNQLYIPVGFQFDAEVNSLFAMGIYFQWMPQVYPTVKIDPLNGARWILTTQLANFRFSVPLTVTHWKLQDWFLTFEPFFEYWKDGATTAVTTAGLALAVPQNTYYFLGIHINAGYSF